MLVLIISEATQKAMIGEDNSMINGALVVATLVGLNILMSLLKQRSKWFDGRARRHPAVIVVDGKPLKDRMDKSRVDEDDDATRPARPRGSSGWTRSVMPSWSATAGSRSFRGKKLSAG